MLRVKKATSAGSEAAVLHTCRRALQQDAQRPAQARQGIKSRALEKFIFCIQTLSSALKSEKRRICMYLYIHLFLFHY